MFVAAGHGFGFFTATTYGSSEKSLLDDAVVVPFDREDVVVVLQILDRVLQREVFVALGVVRVIFRLRAAPCSTPTRSTSWPLR